VVLFARENVPLATRGGLETVALRSPDNRVAQALIKESGLPIAAPSANKSGRPSPTTAEAVERDLGGAVEVIIDGGQTKIGLESTVVDATGDVIAVLRPGGASREELARAAELAPEGEASDARRSPGTRYRHYAPSIAIRLWRGDDFPVRDAAGKKWSYMGMRTPPDGAEKNIIFSSPDEYARGLFKAMRELETCGASVIIADLTERDGIGEAIGNRLSRAAGENTYENF
jgi:L-threonylcarbamoyladenylate synthase